MLDFIFVALFSLGMAAVVLVICALALILWQEVMEDF